MLYQSSVPSGIPYDKIIWEEDENQPLGTAVNFNGFILGNARDIIDVEGAFAVSGDFTSNRVFTVAFGRDSKNPDVPLSPIDVRYLAGKNTSVSGPLNVYGNVVGGGSFDIGTGSSYFIGKSDNPDQSKQLDALYYSPSGSPGWTVSDRDRYYLVSSYDTPRYIPATRINADLNAFFAAAKESLEKASSRLSNLTQNGTVSFDSSGYYLSGTDSNLNIFNIDYRTEYNGISNSIKLDIPEGSTAVITIRTQPNVVVSSPVIGTKSFESRTLINFPDAEKLDLTFPSVFYGSVLAPVADFFAATTGGSINGTAVLGSLSVQSDSGFELHLYPFTGIVSYVQNEDNEYPEYPVCPPCPPATECPSCPNCPPATDCTPCPDCPPCPDCTPCPPCPPSVECPPCHDHSDFGIIEGCIYSCGCSSCIFFGNKYIRVRITDCSSGETIWDECFCGTRCFLFELQRSHSYLLTVFSKHSCKPNIRFTQLGINTLNIEYRS